MIRVKFRDGKVEEIAAEGIRGVGSMVEFTKIHVRDGLNPQTGRMERQMSAPQLVRMIPMDLIADVLNLDLDSEVDLTAPAQEELQ